MSNESLELAQVIVTKCRERSIGLVFAESCTGGKLASAIVDVSGSSDVFIGSFVTYHDQMKIRALGVDGYTLGKGAVSEIVARQMVLGAANFAHGIGLDRLGLKTIISVSTTGYVQGDDLHAYVALCWGEYTKVHEVQFDTDDRAENQRLVVVRALKEIIRLERIHRP